jgi:hypothetical protein
VTGSDFENQNQNHIHTDFFFNRTGIGGSSYKGKNHGTLIRTVSSVPISQKAKWNWVWFLELVPEPESKFSFWKNWIPHSIYVANQN